MARVLYGRWNVNHIIRRPEVAATRLGMVSAKENSGTRIGELLSNEEGPHDSLGKLPPAMFRGKLKLLETLLLNCRIDGEA